MTPEKSLIREKLLEHFGERSPEEIATTGRGYASASRIDLQLAIDVFFENRQTPSLVGILNAALLGESLTLAQLFSVRNFEIGPIQHEDIDIGATERTRCLKNGLWLSTTDGLPFAVLLTTPKRAGVNAVQLELRSAQERRGLSVFSGFLQRP